MPEGPEVRRQADRIGRALSGRVAVSVYFAFPRLRDAARDLTGCRIETVRSRGKALLLTFEGDRVVFTHNQLYGRWLVRRSPVRPSSRRSLRFAVVTGSSSAWLYSASTIEVLAGSELAAHPFLSRLGPDALDPETTARMIRARLRDSSFRRRALGPLLLDQGFVAGLGNYLRSEILFRARVDPQARPRDLDAAQIRRLADAILAVPRRAYETAGITNDPRAVARARAAGLPRRRYRHLVFGREGQPCPRCDDRIEKLEIAGRRLYRCPSCQSTTAGPAEA